MGVNVTKTKKLSNVRASGTDDKVKIVPALNFAWAGARVYTKRRTGWGDSESHSIAQGISQRNRQKAAKD